MNHNLSDALYGRIVIIHDPLIFKLSPILSTRQVIHLQSYHLPSSTSFYISIVYVANSSSARKGLLNLISSFRQESYPWIALGGFSCALKLSDSYGGNALSLAEIKPLNNAIDDSNLIEIKAIWSFLFLE